VINTEEYPSDAGKKPR